MPETIGQQLKQAREAKGLTIQNVVQATHIRSPHIEAFEADDFESLPSPVQARAFLRLYAEFLGLSLDEVISQQRAGRTDLPPMIPVPAASPIEDAGMEAEINETTHESESVKILLIGEKLRLLLGLGKRILSRPGAKPSSAIPVEKADQNVSSNSTDTETSEESLAQVEGTPTPPLELGQSQIIFTAIGKTLRNRRESLSLTLDEIERHTRVRKHYLQALETGEFTHLPSSVQARGMLNNYARFLDLDVDALLLQFADALQIKRVEYKLKPEETSPKLGRKSPFKVPLPIRLPASFRRFLSVDIFIGGSLIILLLLFAVWGTGRIIKTRSDSTPQPTAPSISNILISSPESITITPSPTTTGSGTGVIVPAAGETPVLTLPAAGQGAVDVVVIAQDQAWVRVTVDGKVKFEGRVTAGVAYPFDGNTQIEVLTGNGIAISILYNQSNLGPMGNLGEVVDRIYTSKAILEPTATFTPSPTITPTPTVTLRPTATLRPSSTRRASSTPRVSSTPNH